MQCHCDLNVLKENLKLIDNIAFSLCSQNQGAVPVLYASQWFLSLFSCPFPVPFCSRLIDIMLMQGNDRILQRIALSIMAEFEGELMMQDDFEELLTYLKIAPLKWDSERLRRVLNAATNSPITDEEISIAHKEAEDYIRNEEKSTSDVERSSEAEASEALEDSSPGAASIEKSQASGSDEISSGDEADDVQDQLKRQTSTMNSEYNQMLDELDSLWSEDPTQ